jgi:DNA (cytosine-5)-methyltransferase 1
MHFGVISLFSGAGGLSLGFAQAGLKPIFGVDINHSACITYENNLGIPCHNLDLLISCTYTLEG